MNLIHCGLVTAYGNIDLSQYWLRLWLVAWQHQVITWTTVDLSSKASCGIHLREISQGMLMNIIHNMCLEIWWHHIISLCHNELTLNVRGPSYLGLTRSISWLLLSWLLASPGHHQPWYWLCRMGKSYLRKDFNHLCHINVEERHKM